MGSVFLDVVPLALGIAASPFPIVPAIMLLLTARPRATGGAFLAGWLVGVAGACALFAALASVIEPGEETPTWVPWTKLALGALLVLAAVKQWRQRGKPPDSSWIQALAQVGPAKGLRLGLLLSAANPKILLLAAAGGLAIGSADLARAEQAGTVAVFAAVASCTVALPWLLYVVRGERILGPLERARDWLEAHNATVMALVLAVIGLLLVVQGLTGL